MSGRRRVNGYNGFSVGGHNDRPVKLPSVSTLYDFTYDFSQAKIIRKA
ncbi:unnamed protein product [Tenebrio molitor]|nr:unnamed protein product [Tenebrio molitor]